MMNATPCRTVSKEYGKEKISKEYGKEKIGIAPHREIQQTCICQYCEMSGMVEAHNEVRQEAGIQPLAWSDTVAAFAQQWADHLAIESNCRLAHRPRSGKFAQVYGENLYWASSIRWNNGQNETQKITPATVVSSWAVEARNYDYLGNTCTAGKSCGHYTQLVWGKTKKVGCGRAVCPDSSQIWVCNYFPPGNYVGEKPY